MTRRPALPYSHSENLQQSPDKHTWRVNSIAQTELAALCGCVRAAVHAGILYELREVSCRFSGLAGVQLNEEELEQQLDTCLEAVELDYLLARCAMCLAAHNPIYETTGPER